MLNVSVATDGVKFSDSLKFPMGEGEGAAEVKLGAFLQATFDFLVIAFCIFLMVRMVNKARLAIEGEPELEKPAEDAADIALLKEIRDSLKK